MPDAALHALLLQIVLVILGTWGVGIYSAFAIFGGKKEDKPAPAPAA